MIFDPGKLALSLDSLEKGKRSLGEYTVPLDGFDWNLPDGVPADEPGHLSLEAAFSGNSVLVEGVFTGVFTAQCSRCLEPARIQVQGQVRRVYSDDPELCDDPEVEPVFRRDGWISIFEAVRESVILAMPMAPLCKPGCLGLCSLCGADLNRGDCGHRV